jgi:hypothetical protein
MLGAPLTLAEIPVVRICLSQGQHRPRGAGVHGYQDCHPERGEGPAYNPVHADSFAFLRMSAQDVLLFAPFEALLCGLCV